MGARTLGAYIVWLQQLFAATDMESLLRESQVYTLLSMWLVCILTHKQRDVGIEFIGVSVLPVVGKIASGADEFGYVTSQVRNSPLITMVLNYWGSTRSQLEQTVFAALALVFIMGNMTILLCAMALLLALARKQLARARSRLGSSGAARAA